MVALSRSKGLTESGVAIMSASSLATSAGKDDGALIKDGKIARAPKRNR